MVTMGKKKMMVRITVTTITTPAAAATATITTRIMRIRRKTTIIILTTIMAATTMMMVVAVVAVVVVVTVTVTVAARLMKHFGVLGFVFAAHHGSIEGSPNPNFRYTVRCSNLQGFTDTLEGLTRVHKGLWFQFKGFAV